MVTGNDAMNRQVVILRAPTGPLSADDFGLREAPAPIPRADEALCRTLLLSLDPVNRGLMVRGGDYRAGLGPGSVMAGFAVAEVVEAAAQGGPPTGSVVFGELGWQELAAVRADSLVPVSGLGPLSHELGVLGVNGMTAWFGLTEIGRPRPGETVVVSAAAGATGTVAVQLARHTGCRTIGIVGSAAKVEVVRELGADEVVVRAEPRELRAALRAAAPDGIDVYFDSVGGAVLDSCLALMRPHGRVVCCGTLAAYDAENAPPGPRGVPALVIAKRLRLEGFVVLDFLSRWPQAQAALAELLRAGEVRAVEEIVDGLDRAPAAFVDLLAGGNIGKRMVRVAHKADL
jgi:NADPH-dependent curcumin reductase CurA